MIDIPKPQPKVLHAFHVRQVIEPVAVKFHRDPHGAIGAAIAQAMVKMGDIKKSEKWEQFLQDAAKHGITITLVVAVVEPPPGERMTGV